MTTNIVIENLRERSRHHGQSSRGKSESNDSRGTHREKRDKDGVRGLRVEY